MDAWMTMDAQTKAGVLGQLAGHGAVWAKKILGGAQPSEVFTSETMFWAAFNIASEFLSSYATNLTGTAIAGVAAPAAVQVTTLNMYHDPSKQTISALTRGEVGALLDSPFLAGTLGSVVLKSYA